MDELDHLRPELSERGFMRMPAIASTYGGHVEVYESSSAEEPRIWLKAQCPVDMNKPDGESVVAFIHLPLEDALHLADQMQYLAHNHYQTR